MKEKVICKGETYKRFFTRMFIIGSIVSLVYGMLGSATFSWIFTDDYGHWGYFILAIIFIVFLLLGLLGKLYYKRLNLVVTNKRVYGITLWGKRVDLPLDFISAVGIGRSKTIVFSTPSGRIVFSGIINRDEMYAAINELLLERQNGQSSTAGVTSMSPQSDADELKKFKELLDEGILTPEEFEAKKKQILGL